MSLYVDIEKRLGAFHLRAQLEAPDETMALLGASGCGKSIRIFHLLVSVNRHNCFLVKSSIYRIVIFQSALIQRKINHVCQIVTISQ